MADNLMVYTTASRNNKVKGVSLDYSKNFQQFFTSDLGQESDLLFRLKEVKNQLEKKEQVFYRVFSNRNINSYEDFLKIWEQRKEKYSLFIEDYQKLTHSGLQLNPDIRDRIANLVSDGKGHSKRELGSLPKDTREKYKEKFSEVFAEALITEEKGREAIFHIFDEKIDIEQLSNKEVFNNLYNAVIEEMNNLFDNAFSKKQNFAIAPSATPILKKNQVNRRAVKEIDLILDAYERAFIKAGILFAKSNGYNYNPSHKKQSGFHKKINAALQEKELIIQGELIVPDSKRTSPLPIGIEPIIFAQKTEENVLNNIAKDLISLLDLKSEEAKKIIIRTLDIVEGSQETRAELYKALTSPSGFIGWIGEYFGKEFLQLMLFGEENKGKVSVIGGGNADKIKNKLMAADQWRSGAQPPVDLLIEMSGLSIGIQSKAAFSSSIHNTNAVSFVNKKKIADPGQAKQQRRGIFYTDLNSIMTTKPYSDIIEKNLIPYLQAYYSNRAIMELSYYTNKKPYPLEQLTEEQILTNVVDATDIINKIFALFIDAYMDLGSYEVIREDSKDVIQQRNLFLLYLGEYFIPSSKIIQWGIDQIEALKDNVGATVRVSSRPEIDDAFYQAVEKDATSPVISINNAKNILSYIQLQVETVFQHKNLLSYSFFK